MPVFVSKMMKIIAEMMIFNVSMRITDVKWK